MIYAVSQFAYIVASVCFIFALHWMNTPATARKGVYAGVAGTAIAVIVTWAEPRVVHHVWIVLAIGAGVAVGVPLSRVPLTAVPQRTALSHAFGGLAAGLVGTAEYYLQLSEAPESLTTFRMIALIAEVILGYLTFTGSLMAAGKLQEVRWIPHTRAGAAPCPFVDVPPPGQRTARHLPRDDQGQAYVYGRGPPVLTDRRDPGRHAAPHDGPPRDRPVHHVSHRAVGAGHQSPRE